MLKTRNFQSILALVSVGLAVCIYSVYTPALKNGFVNWDDDVHLLENPFVHHLNRQSIMDIFTTTVNTTYIPLTELSFAIEYHFFANQPFVYHWTNIVLHILVSVMVMFFVLRLGIKWPGAFFAGLVFGIHPMHVESVAWVTERKDVLYAFFYMAALLGYCEYLNCLKEGRRPSVFLLFGILVAGVLSILAKPMAVSLPFVLWVLDWYFKRPFNFKCVIEKLFLGLLLFPAAWVTAIAKQRIVSWHFPESFFLGVWHYASYLRKFFWPDGFFLFYRMPLSYSFADRDCFIAVIILLGFAGVFLFKKMRVLHFAVLFYSASIFFLLPFEQDGFIGYVSDRFMYLASVGFCMVLGACIGYLWERKGIIFKNLCAVGLAALIFFLVGKTKEQIHVWESGVTLWEHQLMSKKVLAPVLLYDKLGQAYFKQWQDSRSFLPQVGQDAQCLVKAVESFKKAIEINGHYADAYRNWGALCLETKDFNCAMSNLNRAKSLRPDDFEIYFQLGRLFLKQGMREEAQHAFKQALRLSPNNLNLYEKVLIVTSGQVKNL